MEAEFEAKLRQAIIEGKPLLRFGLGGASVETWPKGSGPVGEWQKGKENV